MFRLFWFLFIEKLIKKGKVFFFVNHFRRLLSLLTKVLKSNCLRLLKLWRFRNRRCSLNIKKLIKIHHLIFLGLLLLRQRRRLVCRWFHVKEFVSLYYNRRFFLWTLFELLQKFDLELLFHRRSSLRRNYS